MKKSIIILIYIIISIPAFSQEDEKDYGQIHGNFETVIQTYQTDTIIGIHDDEVPKEKVLSNSYLNLKYTGGKFSAGIRYEAYLNTLTGYDPRYNGHGIANRYASYVSDQFEITVGNFYEQFGNGLILRAYEEKTLGIDNAFDGVKVKIKPLKGIKLTGLIGTQRYYWDKAGLVKGVDGEISINETFKKLSESKLRLVFGGSFVTKYQKNLHPVFNYPENVGAFAGRFSLSRNGFRLSSEYAYKINDPSFDNNNIFKDGNALFMNASWSKKGIGLLLSCIRIDNMSFRSDRTASLNDLTINYLPAISKTHTYASASVYPFATQTDNQIGLNAEIFYTFKRNTFLGGKYGTMLNINYAYAGSLKTEKIIVDPDAEVPNLDGYTTEPFAIGDEIYLKDLNIQIQKKLSKKLKFSLIYMLENFNIHKIQMEDSFLNAQIGILDFTYKMSSKHALRFELQTLFIDEYAPGLKNGFGDWYMGTIEYTYSPNWFIAVTDQYNTGGHLSPYYEDAHYYYISAGYTRGSNRIQLGYGRQREGVVCAGGVCRYVPASSGFNLMITSTF